MTPRKYNFALFLVTESPYIQRQKFDIIIFRNIHSLKVIELIIEVTKKWFLSAPKETKINNIHGTKIKLKTCEGTYSEEFKNKIQNNRYASIKTLQYI